MDPGQNPAIAKEQVTLIAGRGIEGDRYAKRDPGHPKQITFFNMDVVDMLAKHWEKPVQPQAVRRNVFIRGVDLPSLVGKKFVLQGIEFEAVDPCPPCVWMDEAVGSGTLKLLAGNGGLRAKIITDGTLSTGPASLEILPEGDVT